MTHQRLTQPADSPQQTPFEEFSPAMVNIRKRFCELAVDRILVFESLKKAVETNQKPEQALDEIAKLAHKITGVASTLGYPAAGKLAADIEQTVRTGVANAQPTQRTWLAIQPVLENLLDELENMLD